MVVLDQMNLSNLHKILFSRTKGSDLTLLCSCVLLVSFAAY